ncbi:SulP family inorganic anion transporter [Rhizobium sp. TRM95796]|uniref:SulP family inorganic anion transporter n=1 Tax=Rhizobium sp. TRM95796 TaxID=2979862 RepID=UPI0021E7DF66|nr:SulP family inorganic anion transporter [Rhizobium sp. TRM95796]MCV3765310.1 SulP family inorganic anion transporter [Rhizobium sp. TRM95796]
MRPDDEVFAPKLWSVYQEGYGFDRLRADLVAGLTVAIVALPLSMAIAIASGVTPAMGLYTAVAGGFLVSAFSGSRHQIGGPAGAFIVLVAATSARHGVDGLILATALSGLMLIAAGWLRLGGFVKYIPYPVTVGFTAGIAVIIFASQLKDLFGLTLAGVEPGGVLEKLAALYGAADSVNIAAVTISLGVIVAILLLKRLAPRAPNLLIAVALATLAAYGLDLPVATIGSRFGGIPGGLPAPAIPLLSLEKLAAVLPDAASFALLGAIESLLSAVVADGMTGRRHRSNIELVGQGVANVGSALFGGFCVTGTIARTATNVRAGAKSPVAGMAHALFLLAFMALLAPVAAYIPLAALAGVLTSVAWNMIEKPAVAALLRSSRGDALVLSATFLIVVFRDLTEGILAGFLIGSVLFIDRMSKEVRVRAAAPEPATPSELDDAVMPDDPDIVVYRLEGAFFFGAAASMGAVLDRISDSAQIFILDVSRAAYIDSTAANVVEGMARKARQRGVTVIIAGASPDMDAILRVHHAGPPLTVFAPSIERALEQAAALRSAR